MLIEDYNIRVARGELRSDECQLAVLQHLNRLGQQISEERAKGWIPRFRGKKSIPKIRSIYIWGPVGRGKTHVMDLFFSSVPVPAKRRVHFHAFMRDVHQRLHEARKIHASSDAIQKVASDLARDIRLLCLDEMQISDIADAMIVGRLFETLLASQTVIVTTSNQPPKDLYKDGLNRALFEPFIALLESRFEVVELGGPVDYRLNRVKAHESFLTPLGPETDRKLQELWERLTDTTRGTPEAIPLLGRVLKVPQAAKACARFSFADLCEAPLGSPDYLALAQSYGTIFVEHIPVLDRSKRNEAKRFILLIDTLYDQKVRLVASSEALPEGIYSGGDHAAEFQRTVSRLREMQSAGWWGGRIVET
jgi:cell division protein ZapE